MIDLASLSAESLKNGIHDPELPEFTVLRQTIENNLWHDHQSVFDHIAKVLTEVEKLVERENFAQILNENVSKHSRKELLRLATLLHDVAKGDLLISDSTGSTKAVGHEFVGAARAKYFSSRFGLDDKEIDYVSRIILYHGYVSEIVNLIMSENNTDKWKKVFREVVDNIELELYIFILADVKGSDLNILAPEDYQLRVKVIEQLIESFYGSIQSKHE